MGAYIDDEQGSRSSESRKERRWNIPVPVRVQDEEAGVLEDPEDGGVIPVVLGAFQ